MKSASHLEHVLTSGNFAVTGELGPPKSGDPEVVRKVIRMVNRNEFKRRQMPPGLKVTSKAFGVGRRFPIAAKLEG